FFALSLDGRIEEINAKAANFFGRHVKDLLGKVLWDTFPAVKESEFPEHFNTAVQTRRLVQFEAPSKLQPGRWWERHIHPLGSRVDVYFRDISARKNAEAALRESEERFRTLVEQASDAVFLHDDTGRFIDLNRRACESLGYTRDELLRIGVLDVEMEVERTK